MPTVAPAGPEAFIYRRANRRHHRAGIEMDPVDVRRKNFPKSNEFPFGTATGLFYDTETTMPT